MGGKGRFFFLQEEQYLALQNAGGFLISIRLLSFQLLQSEAPFQPPQKHSQKHDRLKGPATQDEHFCWNLGFLHLSKLGFLPQRFQSISLPPPLCPVKLKTAFT